MKHETQTKVVPVWASNKHLPPLTAKKTHPGGQELLGTTEGDTYVNFVDDYGISISR